MRKLRLLLFSDLHCDHSAARKLVELAAAVDIVVGAGDYATTRNGLAETLEQLAPIEKPVVLVPGNGESDVELLRAVRRWPSAHALHGSGVTVDGIPFFGLGGGVPVTPFGSWSFDLDEQQAARKLSACPSGAVLVTHSPPQGVLDVDGSGRSLGSQSVRQCVLTCRPRLVVCGHIHNCVGQHALLDGVPVVNAGPAGIVWQLQEVPR